MTELVKMFRKPKTRGYGEISNLDRIKDTDAARARIAADQGEPIPESEEKEKEINEFSDKEVEQKADAEGANPDDDKEERPGVNMDARLDPKQSEIHGTALEMLKEGNPLEVDDKGMVKVSTRKKGAGRWVDRGAEMRGPER